MERTKNRLPVTSIHVMEDIPVLHIQSEKLLRKLIEDQKKIANLYFPTVLIQQQRKDYPHNHVDWRRIFYWHISWLFSKKNN